MSRLYLGVHYRFDATSGTALGLNIGTQVQSNVLTEHCRCPAPVSVPVPAGEQAID